MLRSLNSGVSGLRAFQTKLDVIGNNIANVNTTGFKKGRVIFDDIFSQTMKNATAPTGNNGGVNPTQVGLGSKVAAVENLFTPGSPSVTNNPNDLYIDGDGFFLVQDGNGEEYLTRAGNFTLDGDKQLVNPNGMVVLDSNGDKIALDVDTASYTIGADGTITAFDKAGEELDTWTIEIVTVDNPSGLQKAGGSVYKTTANSGEELRDGNPSGAQIITGQLEMSNVDLSEEMTEMIIAQRAFQANTKIITTSDSILEELVNLKR
jgi:flagellar hook protein FlgE